MLTDDKVVKYDVDLQEARDIVVDAINERNIEDEDFKEKYGKVVLETVWGTVTLNYLGDVSVNLVQIPDEAAKDVIEAFEDPGQRPDEGGEQGISEGKIPLSSIESKDPTQYNYTEEHVFDKISPQVVFKDFEVMDDPDEVLANLSNWFQVAMYKTWQTGKEHGFFVDKSDNVIGVLEGDEESLGHPPVRPHDIIVDFHTHPERSGMATPSTNDLKFLAELDQNIRPRLAQEAWVIIGTDENITDGKGILLFMKLVDVKTDCPSRHSIRNELKRLGRKNEEILKAEGVDEEKVEARLRGHIGELNHKVSTIERLCKERSKTVEFELMRTDITDMGPYKMPENIG